LLRLLSFFEVKKWKNVLTTCAAFRLYDCGPKRFFTYPSTLPRDHPPGQGKKDNPRGLFFRKKKKGNPTGKGKKN
jgi:hypothetical protein